MQTQQEPWNEGYDQANQQTTTTTTTKSSQAKLPNEMREDFERFQRSKDRTFLCMLICVMVFLVGSMACGGVAVAMVPWWKHSRGRKSDFIDYY